MNFNSDYFSMKHFEELMDSSIHSQRECYSYLEGNLIEEWERNSLGDFLLSQKVFDI